MILYLSGRDTDELLMVLEGVRGVVIKRSDERKKRKQFERGARKESMGAASAAIFLGRDMMPQSMATVRDIVVEGVRAKRVDVVVKDAEGAETSFSAPIDDEDILRALADALA